MDHNSCRALYNNRNPFPDQQSAAKSCDALLSNWGYRSSYSSLPPKRECKMENGQIKGKQAAWPWGPHPSNSLAPSCVGVCTALPSPRLLPRPQEVDWLAEMATLHPPCDAVTEVAAFSIWRPVWPPFSSGTDWTAQCVGPCSWPQHGCMPSLFPQGAPRSGT